MANIEKKMLGGFILKSIHFCTYALHPSYITIHDIQTVQNRVRLVPQFLYAQAVLYLYCTILRSISVILTTHTTHSLVCEIREIVGTHIISLGRDLYNKFLDLQFKNQQGISSL